MTAATIHIEEPLVSVAWLKEHFKAPNLIVLDATMGIAGAKEDGGSLKKQIPGARFLDIKNVFSDTTARFPNTLLSQEEFSEAAQRIGINNESALVVYDDKGIYSSPRVWWMFTSMGHRNIAVLDGGLPAWTKNGFPLETSQPYTGNHGSFLGSYHRGFMKNYHEILTNLSNEKLQILDARSSERFSGSVEEPRPGLRSGHIPKSKNLPYATLLNGNLMKSKEDLEAIYTDFNEKDLIFSCGSGITACILALAADHIGIKNKAVYDGSWTEWGSLHELPIEK